MRTYEVGTTRGGWYVVRALIQRRVFMETTNPNSGPRPERLKRERTGTTDASRCRPQLTQHTSARHAAPFVVAVVGPQIELSFREAPSCVMCGDVVRTPPLYTHCIYSGPNMLYADYITCFYNECDIFFRVLGTSAHSHRLALRVAIEFPVHSMRQQ